MENRRFRLGPFRLIPVFRLANAGYDSNVFGARSGSEISDWTATATAGFRWIVPAGSKLYVLGDALPQYVWYKDLADRRSFGGLYRTSLLGFFNRASLDVGGFNSKTLTSITSETETQVIQTALDGWVRMEVDVASNLSVFGAVEAARLRFGLAGGGTAGFVDINQFQRTEAAARGGVRYRISSEWDISASYEKTRTKFVDVPERRDNQSDGYILGLRYDRPRFFVNLSGGYRQGGPYNGSSFVKYSAPTGSYFVSYYLTRKVELQAYGDRRVSYGQTITQFLESRYGGRVNFQVHPRVLLRVFGSDGTNGYGATSSGATVTPARSDRRSDYGAGFSAIVYRKVVLSAYATESRYRSSLPGLERNVIRFTTGLSFDGVFPR